MSVHDPYYIQKLGLLDRFQSIWAANERGEITIRQAHDQCDAAVRSSQAAERERLERPYREARQRMRASVEKAKITRAKTKEWREGVAKIMAEMRRREAMQKPRYRVPAICCRVPHVGGLRP